MYIKFLSWSFTFVVLFFVMFGANVHETSAIEPETELFHKEDHIRHQAYRHLSHQISESLERSIDEKEMQHLLLQQQLLEELKELPESIEDTMPDTGFADIASLSKVDLIGFEKYLQMYIDVIKEDLLSTKSLDETEKQKQELYARLLALPENSPEETMLQLQYAYQVRKLKHQSNLDQKLKKRLKKARELYREVLGKIDIATEEVKIQKETVKQAKEIFLHLKEDRNLASTGDETRIEQQESLLAGFMGKELNDDEKKIMHYEQLKLLELRTRQLTRESEAFKAQLICFAEEQKLLWLRILLKNDDYFHITDLSGDLTKHVGHLRKKTAKAQVRKYTYEKELAFLRGGNALIGPKSEELIEELDNQLSHIFTMLSGVYKNAETLESKGKLLKETIDLQQSTFGSVVTKTREATDNIVEKVGHVLKYPIISYSGMTLTLLVVLQILLLLIVGIVVNRVYGHVVIRMGTKRKWTERTIQLVHAMGKYPFIIIVAMIFLSVIGINTSSLAIVAGALSVGIGFGLQTIVNNLVSGIILLFDKSIRPGDFISLGDHAEKGGYRGNVVQMNTRSTVLRTNDNINIIIPNADLMASQVVNWTYSDEKIRFRVPFSVAYGTDIEQVKNVVQQAIRKLPVVLTNPEPQIWLAQHAESSLSFLAAIWVEGQNARRPAYTFDIVLTEIYKILEQHNIEIPFPQMDLHLRDYGKLTGSVSNTGDLVLSTIRN